MEEPQSGALAGYVEGRAELISSVVAAVEVLRSAGRSTDDPRAIARAERLMESFDLVSLGEEVLVIARRLRPAALGSLDAIHVASALTLGEALESFVSYDRRQIEAAAEAGLRVESPVD